MNNSSFNIRYRGRTTGPFDTAQLTEMIQRGQVTRLHEIAEDDGQWQRLRDRPDLLPQTQAITRHNAMPAAAAESEADTIDLDLPQSEDEYAASDTPPPTDDGQARWWFSLDQHKHGPVTREEIKEVLALNRDAEDSILIWRKGMGEWLPPREAGFGGRPVPAQPALASVQQPTADSVASYSDTPGDDHASLRMAGFWLRAVALVIDAIILQVIQFGIAIAIGFTLPDVFNQASEGQFVLFAWLLSVGTTLPYFAMGESSRSGGTPGKRALGLRVIHEDGSPITFGQAVGRYLGKILSSLILCIGFLMAAIGPNHQSLHDHISRTFVIQD